MIRRRLRNHLLHGQIVLKSPIRGRPRAFLGKNVNPFFVSDHDVGKAIFIDVARNDLRADAGIFVDQVGHELDGFIGAIT